MSPRFGRNAGAGDHERARDLASLRMDEPLADGDARWLDAHLGSCPACAAMAASFDDDRLLLRSLRTAEPQAPRDLWARTAAALEAEADRHPGRPVPVRRRFGLFAADGRHGTLTAQRLVPLAALAVAAVAVGVVLLPGTLLPAGGGDVAVATPITLTAGNVQVLRRGENGSLEIQTSSVDQVCPLAADSCLAEPNVETAPLMALGGTEDLGGTAIVSPDRDRVVLLQSGDTGMGVYVVPFSGGAVLPTEAPATPAPTRGATAAPSSTPATAPTTPPATASPVAPSASPDAQPTPSESPDATASDTPSEDPVESTTPETPAPETPAPETPAPETPAPTAEPTPELTPEPTPGVEVTPMPGGVVRIAKDVIVTGSAAAYDSKGRRFAFSARPADGSRGSDVFVWTSGQPLARAVTSDHSSVFAGWQGGHLLVSRVVDGVPGTYKVDPTPGAALGDRVSDGWRPAVAPDGRSAVWWDGDLKLAADGVSLVPAGGRLVLGPWGSGDGTRQVLAEGKVKDWEIRWAPDGSVLAVWLAGERARDPGSLSLYRIDGDTGRARLGKPMLEDEPAMDGFSLESGRLAFPVRADGKTVIRILAWAGDEMGWSELPAEPGTTVVRNP